MYIHANAHMDTPASIHMLLATTIVIVLQLCVKQILASIGFQVLMTQGQQIQYVHVYCPHSWSPNTADEDPAALAHPPQHIQAEGAVFLAHWTGAHLGSVRVQARSAVEHSRQSPGQQHAHLRPLSTGASHYDLSEGGVE